MNVASVFEECARRYPSTPALRDLESGLTLDFTQLHDGLRRVASHLDERGVAPGERVGLLGGSGSDYLLCDYGVMAAGRVRVPVDPSLSAAEQVAQLQDAEAKLLICSPAHAARAAQLAQRVSGLQVEEAAVVLAHSRLPEARIRLADAMLASLSYTGGTTGAPKAAMVTHGSLTAAVRSIVEARGMGPGDVMLNVRPAWPIAAIVLLAHLAAGGTVVMGGKFEPRLFMELLVAQGAAATCLVPTHLARLMDEVDPAAYDLSRLRSIDVGAAAIPSDLFARALQAFGPRIGVIYGLTEAPWSCYLPPAALDVPTPLQQLRMRLAGRPLAGVQICARAASGEPLPPGEEGEITIRGAHVMAGYWRRPDADANALRDGWFHTGDLGSIDAEGWLRVTGRLKALIRTGGKSVVPAEVEATLMSHARVAEAVVLGLPDAEWGEIVAAAVVLRHDAQDPRPVGEQDLIDWCRDRLSSFKKPRRVIFLDEIPRSHYGKPLLARLRERIVSAA